LARDNCSLRRALGNAQASKESATTVPAIVVCMSFPWLSAALACRKSETFD
jgi:hypothetical protein